MKRSLLLLPYILLIAVLLLLAGLVWETQILERWFTERAERELELSTKLSALAMRDFLQTANEDSVDENETYALLQNQLAQLLPPTTRITILQNDGTVLADTWENPQVMTNHLERAEVTALQEKIAAATKVKNTFPCVSFERYSTTTRQNLRYCITELEYAQKFYFVRAAVAVQENAAHSLHRPLIFWAAGIVVLATILGLLFTFGIARPLAQLSTFAQQRGNSETLLPTLHGHSLKQIARTLSEISEQLQTKTTELTHEKTLHSTIFETLVEGVILLDERGMISKINRAAAAILETRAEFALQRPLTFIWRHPEIAKWLGDFLASTNEEKIVKEIQGSRGEKNINLTCKPINLPKQKHFLLVLYDFTPIKKLTNYRRDFMANLSHEMKTPLTVIVGIVETLLDEPQSEKRSDLPKTIENSSLENPAAQRGGEITEGEASSPTRLGYFLQTLAVHTQRLSRLLDDVLALAKLECAAENQSLVFENLPLAETVEVAIALCKPHADARQMKIEFVDNTSAVQAENCRFVPQLIEQAVINLVENALKYSTPGDVIRVILEVIADNTLGNTSDVMLEPHENIFSLRVEDHGRGIPLEHRQRIFERFYRVDPSRDRQTGGTGLGLAIVKYIAQLHRGTISMSPTHPTGATFTLRFPRTRYGF